MVRCYRQFRIHILRQALHHCLAGGLSDDVVIGVSDFPISTDSEGVGAGAESRGEWQEDICLVDLQRHPRGTVSATRLWSAAYGKSSAYVPWTNDV